MLRVCVQLLDNSILKEYHEAVFILLYALQSDIYISSCFCFYSVVDIHLYSKKQKILLFSFLTKRREFFLSFLFLSVIGFCFVFILCDFVYPVFLRSFLFVCVSFIGRVVKQKVQCHHKQQKSRSIDGMLGKKKSLHHQWSCSSSQ